MKIFSKAADTKMQSKKLSAIKISSAILLYLCVILIIGFAGCAPKDEGSNTATTQSATDLQLLRRHYDRFAQCRG